MSKRKIPVVEDPVKPALTTKLRREGRLARIAKALVSGATVTEIEGFFRLERLFRVSYARESPLLRSAGLLVWIDDRNTRHTSAFLRLSGNT